MKRFLSRRTLIPALAVGATVLLSACGGSGGGGGGSSTNSSASTGYGGYGSYGSGGSASTSGGTSGSSVKLVNTSVGKILATSRGFTLYLFTADGHNKDNCVKNSGCAAAWPPLTVSGHPTAGAGVNSALLATIKLPNGHQQVTYKGHPLYRYAGDGAPGGTGYIGVTSFGGTWDAVNAAGQAVH